MPLEVILVDRNIFYAHDALESFHLDNRVHHEKWIAMRQQFLNFHDVQYHSRSPSPRTPSAAPGPSSTNFQLYANPALRDTRSLLYGRGLLAVAKKCSQILSSCHPR